MWNTLPHSLVWQSFLNKIRASVYKRDYQRMGEFNSQIIYVKDHKFLKKSFTIVICYTSHTKLLILNFPVILTVYLEVVIDLSWPISSPAQFLLWMTVCIYKTIDKGLGRVDNYRMIQSWFALLRFYILSLASLAA